ncbi:MAG: hypothetical protein V1792_29075 [Pseudomonadota bacterium]
MSMERNGKPKYEKPALIEFDLLPVMTQQQCSPVGSAPIGNQCMDGGLAGGKCQAGSVASGSQCHGGSSAGGKCQGGSVAGGRCQGGSVPY